ncbi:MAG: DUF5684 domain-containing protein [Halolamina sp.]
MLPSTALTVPLQNPGGGAGGAVMLVVWFVVMVATIAGMWKTFEKAGEPGWAAIVPLYNFYVVIKIGGNAWWYLLLLFVPLVNILVNVKIFVDLAKAFDQGIGFGLGIWVLPFVFLPLLGFGDDYEYVGASA